MDFARSSCVIQAFAACHAGSMPPVATLDVLVWTL
jgi:hypothetical protein